MQTDDIINISPSAVEKIRELIESRNRGELAVRVIIRGHLPGGSYQSEFTFVTPDDLKPDDIVQDTGAFKMFYAPGVAESIRGALVDFDESKYSSGFHIEYPPQVAGYPADRQRRDWTDPLAISVQKVIDNVINPGVAMHGGWVILHDVKENAAYVEMGGGCQGCGISQVTLREGITRLIMEQAPDIKQVIDTTNHEAGEHPYYDPSAEQPESALAQN